MQSWTSIHLIVAPRWNQGTQQLLSLMSMSVITITFLNVDISFNSESPYLEVWVAVPSTDNLMMLCNTFRIWFLECSLIREQHIWSMGSWEAIFWVKTSTFFRSRPFLGSILPLWHPVFQLWPQSSFQVVHCNQAILSVLEVVQPLLEHLSKVHKKKKEKMVVLKLAWKLNELLSLSFSDCNIANTPGDDIPWFIHHLGPHYFGISNLLPLSVRSLLLHHFQWMLKDLQW